MLKTKTYKLILLLFTALAAVSYGLYLQRGYLRARGLELVFKQMLGQDAKVNIGRAEVDSDSFAISDLEIESSDFSLSAKTLQAKYSYKEKILNQIVASGAKLQLKSGNSSSTNLKLPAAEILMTDSSISFEHGSALYSLKAGELKSKGTTFPIDVGLKNASFESADGNLALNGLSLSGTVSESRVKLRLNLKEALLGTFYQEFTDIPISLNLSIMRGSMAAEVNLAKPIKLSILDQEIEAPTNWNFSWSAKSGQTHFSTKQSITKEAFGGKITATGLSCIVKPSELPRCGIDLEAKDIDLGRLTESNLYGRIFGVVDAKVKRLTLLGTVPQYFEASLESQDQGKRAISVKAINNISEISAGTGALESGLFQFFDYYGYKKIAISCSLKDNVFTLRGHARPNSEKYLIYGGFWPPKLDLLIQNPYISFSEMVNRIGRVGRQNAEVR